MHYSLAPAAEYLVRLSTLASSVWPVYWTVTACFSPSGFPEAGSGTEAAPAAADALGASVAFAAAAPPQHAQQPAGCSSSCLCFFSLLGRHNPQSSGTNAKMPATTEKKKPVTIRLNPVETPICTAGDTVRVVTSRIVM